MTLAPRHQPPMLPPPPPLPLPLVALPTLATCPPCPGCSKYGGSTPVTGEDLRSALDSVLEGMPNPRKVVPSIGCNIKWHPGRAPTWFHG